MAGDDTKGGKQRKIRMQTETRERVEIYHVESLEEDIKEVEDEMNSLRNRVSGNTRTIAENRKACSVLDERTTIALKLLFTVLIGFIVSIGVKFAEVLLL